MEFASEAERRAAAIEALRGTPPPQGAPGGEPHDFARPDREAVELWLEANGIAELGGVINPTLIPRNTPDDDGAPISRPEFGGGFGF